MSWWMAFGFACYVALLLWQANRAIDLGLRGLVFVPLFVIKIGVVALAYSYWVPDLCLSAASLSKYVLFIACWSAVIEAFANMRFVLIDSSHPAEVDTFLIVWSLLSTIVFPGFMLWFVVRVIWFHTCAT